MFQHLPPAICWSSYTDPKTMVNVGTNAIALLCQNIVVFHNKKTQAKAYYKGDHAQTCNGISLLAGHNRFPLFAIAESVLCPTIFVLNYPEMEKLTAIHSNDVTGYLDLRFSEYGFLAALTDAPEYSLRLWNYRTGALYTSVNTHKRCSKYSLCCATTAEPIVAQYSMWTKEIIVWMLCHTSDQYNLYEISRIDLNDDFAKSKQFLMTLWDDGNVYVVNDYGVLFALNATQFSLRSEWEPPTEDRKSLEHSLYYNKTGLILANCEKIYFLKRRQSDWTVEWSTDTKNILIKKIIADYNNDIYAANDFGNIYFVEHVGDVGDLQQISMSNCHVLDYVLLRGVKDEVVLLLTQNGELRLVDLIRMNIYSNMYIEGACAITMHNASPIAAVGTLSGKVHYISYEKLRAPVELGSLEVENAAINLIRLYDNSAFVTDISKGWHIISNDFKACEFQIIAQLARNVRNILELFLLPDNRALMFTNFEKNQFVPLATEANLLRWTSNDLRVHRKDFDLPFTYRGFALIQPCPSDGAELLGIRSDGYVIDILMLTQNTQLKIVNSIKTYNMGQLTGINGSRNVIVSATQGIVYQFRSHKRVLGPYMISRLVLGTYEPRMRKRYDDCYNAKYLLVLYAGGCLLSYRLPLLVDALKENQINKDFIADPITPRADRLQELKKSAAVFIPNVTENDINKNKLLTQELNALQQAMRELIDYDISVTGKRHGIYSKFCLNENWWKLLIEQARVLRDSENKSLLESIKDQTRIRDWILDLIQSKTNVYGTKLRTIFSNIYAENYSMRGRVQEGLDKLDIFQFYDAEPLNEDDGSFQEEKSHEEEGEEEEQVASFKRLHHFVIKKGESVYDHVMSKEFDMQDTKIVTFNQMYNEDAKLKFYIVDPLKEEFNKEFALTKNFKHEMMNNILDTNDTLLKIYFNINCMLCLLSMEKYQPPPLTVPTWSMDEDIKCILTVNDSEIKAINRRKKISVAAKRKSGRILLWPAEYWVRAIMVMMDGVLEKLWEEEIKKTPLPPEFTQRKQEHEYTMEELKLLNEYQNILVKLEEDRHKYLRILRENEVKTLKYKNNYIMKLNEKLTETAIWKLKYDFAVTHERLRLLNIRNTCFKRIDCRRRIDTMRAETDRIVSYLGKYGRIFEFCERTFTDVKSKLESQSYRDKQLERQFKGQYLSTIPAHLTHELNKLYKRRPKLPPKAFNMANVSYEVADRIVAKKQAKFPLSQDLLDFLNLLDELDDVQNSPHQLDPKHWEAFTKLRRQKLESELRLKGIGYQLIDAQNAVNYYSKEISALRTARTEKGNLLMETLEIYHDTVQNQKLEIILTMGQIEIQARGNPTAFNDCLLMHVNEIDAVNELIRQAGTKKLNAMQRVAFFRRQVIYKEWEHHVIRANIEYLRYILNLVEKCKVTYEFLEVLRNWSKVEDNKHATSRLGEIENAVDLKILNARKSLDRIYKKIDIERLRIDEMKCANQMVNRKIDELKTDVTMLNVNRDIISEEKLAHQRSTRMANIKVHRNLIDTVRRDYVHILELSTILELQRLRTYPTLGPPPSHCVCTD